MVTFKDHITGDVLVTADNGTFEVDELFFKFPANFIQVKKPNFEELQTVVDVVWQGKMKIFDMWRVEKDIFDFGEKLGELVEKKMDREHADFTYMVDYIFALRAWFRANRDTKDIKVYMGPSSTYISHAYVRNFTPVFVREENGKPFIYIFRETVHTDGLLAEQMGNLKVSSEMKEQEEQEQEEKCPEIGTTISMPVEAATVQ